MHEFQHLGDADTTDAEAVTPPRDLDACALYLVVGSEEKVQVVPIADASVLTIGRGQACSLQFEDTSLSRVHARLTREGPHVRITNLQSRNGVRVNGVPVEDALMSPSDVAVLGNTTVSLLPRPSTRAAALGLLGRDVVLHVLDAEWERSRRFRRPVSVILVRAERDLDAAAFADRVRRGLRECDSLGLLDRKTLMAVLPETATQGARDVAEAIRAGLMVPGRGLRFGVAAYPETQLTPESLMSAAREAADCCDDGAGPIRLAPPESHIREVQPGSTAAVCLDPTMQRLDALIARVAPRNIPVLVTGETGAGKELVAMHLHQRSHRTAAPLRIVNCAAIPDSLVESVLFGHVRGAFTGADAARKGVFEQAQGGTVFLDEIGELSPPGQAALLRVLDSGRILPIGADREVAVDVRVVAATHRDLERMVADGCFRLDLLHRLNAVVLAVPPLRERRSEIRPLAERFARLSAAEEGREPYRIDAAALAVLESHPWPGNVRELRNAIFRAAVMCDGHVITVDDLPVRIRSYGSAQAIAQLERASDFDQPLDLRKALKAQERALMAWALDQARGNQRRAAELLSLPLRTFERKLREQALGAGHAERG